MSVLSETEQENVTKASRCAALLVSDIDAIAASTTLFWQNSGLMLSRQLLN